MYKLKNILLLVLVLCFSVSTFSFSQVAQQQAPQGGHPSDEEFSTFIDAFKQVQAIDQQAQQQIISALGEEDLDVERFNEIQQATQHPDHNIPMTEEEQQNFDAAMEKVHHIQTNAQGEMQQEIEEQGISVQRYQEIVGLIQQTPELMEKFQNELQ